MKYILREQPDGLCKMPVVAQEKAHAVGEEADSVTLHGRVHTEVLRTGVV